MTVFARVLVGVDGTEWGLEALRQTLVLAPPEHATVRTVTALDTRAAARAGFGAARWVEMLTEEASAARDAAAAILADRPDSAAEVVPGEPLPVLRMRGTSSERRSSRSGAGTAVASSGSCSATPPPSSCTTARARCSWPAAAGQDVAAPSRHHRSRRLRPCNRSPRDGGQLAARLGATVEVVCANGAQTAPDGAWTDRVDSWDEAQPVAALVERSRRTDLVVVGSRGLHGLHALGSVSERVAHHARCSVLVVHDGTAVGGGA